MAELNATIHIDPYKLDRVKKALAIGAEALEALTAAREGLEKALDLYENQQDQGEDIIGVGHVMADIIEKALAASEPGKEDEGFPFPFEGLTKEEIEERVQGMRKAKLDDFQKRCADELALEDHAKEER